MEFTNKNLDNARSSMRIDRNAALGDLGTAIHTLQDMASPTHTAADGTPFTWNAGPIEAVTHVFGEMNSSVAWGRFGQAVRNTIAGYLEGGGSLPSQYQSADAWAQAAISGMVSEHFATSAGTGANNADNAIAEDAARQCALGNRAACD